MANYGPFGRNSKGRTAVCTCTACCGRTPSEMPDTLYVKVQDNHGNTIYFPMHRYVSASTQCNCTNDGIGAITWNSNAYRLVDDGVINPDSSDEVCCIQVGLSAVCVDGQDVTTGECGWALSVNFTGGESLGVVLDVSPSGAGTRKLTTCDPIEGTFTLTGVLEAAACILQGNSLETYSVQISESSLGPEATPCRWTCCYEYPAVLYATITSSCAKLDGVVIVLQAVGSSWSGNVESCCECGTISVTYNPGIWSTAETQCGVGAYIDLGSTCMSKQIATGGIQCPPFTFSNTWQEVTACLLCCPAGTTISIEITE